MPLPAPTEPAWYDDTYNEDEQLRESSVQRVADRVTLTPHELMYSEIRTSWLAPANDAEAAHTSHFPEVGATARVPFIASASRARAAAEVDHQWAFVLDLVDGQTTLDGIAEASSLPVAQALRTLADLLDQGAIKLR
jgi:hypothetical protein